ncbi:hypothetical protein IAU59_001054 [Kwoniella sp. CBS 9459]
MGFLKPHKRSDYPSTLLYILDETHITVTLSTALAILWTRDAHVAWFALGALNSSLSAKVLKELIRSPRPPPPDPSSKPSRVRPKRTYGMPSTHSTALTFYFIYLLPFALSSSFSSSSSAQSSSLPSSLSLISGAGLIAYWSAGLWSRKELGYHTWEQIFGGAAYGTLLALGWKAAWKAYPAIGTGLQYLIDTVWRIVVG